MTGPTHSPKQVLRTQLRAARRAVDTDTYAQDGHGIEAHLLQVLHTLHARRITAYLSASTEPNTRPFLNTVLDLGIEVLLPIPRHDGLMDWVLADGESERMNDLGVPEPIGPILSPLAMDEVDLIIAPALAVDQDGYRLGQGGGYYDRMLRSMSHRPPVLAVIRDTEVLNTLPRERTDQPVDGGVTPTRILNFSHRTPGMEGTPQ